MKFLSNPWVSQFVEIILKKPLFLSAFLIFLPKVNYNFFTDLLKYQSKNHTPEFDSLMDNSLFSEYKYEKIPGFTGIFDFKTLIFIILKSTFCKKKKKMFGQK
ncbi:hypothetical protein [Mesomycoplasma ovipneumoniae]|uniref:hypothetical protein n=1 Tax=Mesomycoplasma ovipneumoniae TaxID=29562 RepID=UPI00083E7C50|nr:hypothetical protein [Mesomycoplasma ovipneumoniae]WDV48644.1 hypothetical protein PWA39_03870 [Mesomycoplasma ovipneumoniae ATCC 29419]